ncbi:SDR family oxidoreductase [bacterium]|nr:MAG: SDR family oxidoreductase [bacterium]
MLMNGKVCAVTGAASKQGIGRITAELLAEHGARVALLDVSPAVTDVAGEIGSRYPGSSALGIRCNVASGEECERAAAEIEAAFGSVDVLIHCAAVIRSGRHDQISQHDFEDVLSINLTGAFNVARAFSPGMARKQAGSIVFVSSVAGQRGGGLVGGAHYAASKGGVLALAKTLARELGASGVRVNAVCPSLIATDYVTDTVPAERLKDMTASIPMGRLGRPEEVAGACLYLGSDLSTYTTGATLDVNGGLHMH